jgi:hypothetical protein
MAQQNGFCPQFAKVPDSDFAARSFQIWKNGHNLTNFAAGDAVALLFLHFFLTEPSQFLKSLFILYIWQQVSLARQGI